LVVGEIAMATALLLVGALFFTGFAKLLRADLGYDSSGVLTFRVAVPTTRSADERQQFAEVLVRRLGLFPDVLAAGTAGSLPLTLSEATVPLTATPPEAGPSQPAPPPPPPGTMPPPGTAIRNVVSQDLLAALGTRVVRGRGFDDGDRAGSLPVALINEAVVRSGMVGNSPIGSRVYAIGRAPWTIVGVVEDVIRAPGAAPVPQVYFDRRQAPVAPQYFVVRTGGDPTQMAPRIRALVTELEPQGTAVGMVSMEQVVSNSLSRQRLLAALIGGFAVLAAALASIGIYSLVGFVVAQRTQEIGIRTALGARRGQVFRLILGQTAFLTVVGITIGLTGAALLTRQLGHHQYGLSAPEPLVFILTPATFALITLAAAMGPARRATTLDPADVLRAQ
jgi:putative ABC transport system permease protein